MGIANRVVNILVLVAAITAIVLGIMLFNKREDIAKSRELMAKNIAVNAKKLFPPSKIAAKDMGIEKTSEDIKKPLAVMDSARKSILKQRVQMADDILALASIPAEEVGMDGFTKESLASHDKYAGEMKNVKEFVTAKVKVFTETRKVLYESIPQLHEKLRMEKPDEGKFTNDAEGVDFVKGTVGALEKKADDVCTRNETFDQHIKAIANLIPNMDLPVLDGADYAENLKNQRDQIEKYVAAYEGIVRERNAYKEETIQQKKQITEIGKKLESAEQLAAKRAKELKSAKKQIARLEKIIRPAASDSNSEAADSETSGAIASFTLLKKLQGKILFVDEDHGFVLVDLGRENQVEFKNAKGVMEKKQVPVPQNAIMTVSASLDPEEARFTGKIQIVNISDKQSIANILPTPENKIPSVGDVVYFSNPDLDNIRAERERGLKEMQEKAAKDNAAIQAGKSGDAGALLGGDEKSGEESASGEEAETEEGSEAEGGSAESESAESAEDDVI